MIEKFDWLIYSCEVDDYFFSMITTYGEKSPIIKVLDNNYEQFSHIKGHCERLNAIRSFLCEKGFEKQVVESDKKFLNKLYGKLETFHRYVNKIDKEIRADSYMKHLDKEMDLNKFDVDKIQQYVVSTGKAFHMLPIEEQKKFFKR